MINIIVELRGRDYGFIRGCLEILEKEARENQQRVRVSLRKAKDADSVKEVKNDFAVTSGKINEMKEAILNGFILDYIVQKTFKHIEYDRASEKDRALVQEFSNRGQKMATLNGRANRDNIYLLGSSIFDDRAYGVYLDYLRLPININFKNYNELPPYIQKAINHAKEISGDKVNIDIPNMKAQTKEVANQDGHSPLTR